MSEESSQPSPIQPTPPAEDLSQQVTVTPTVAAAKAADGTSHQPSPQPTPPANNPGPGSGPTDAGAGGITSLLDVERVRELAKQKFDEELKRMESGEPAPTPPAPQPAQPTPAPTPDPAPAPVTPSATDDDPPADGTGRRQQIKFRPQDDLDETVLRMAKATGKPATDLAVINAARQFHGMAPLVEAGHLPESTATPTASAASPAEAASHVSDPTAQPTTSADAERRIAELRKQRTEANNNLDFETAEAIDAKIDALSDLRLELRESERLKQQHEQEQGKASFQHEWTKNATLAAENYPESADPDSPVSRRARELQLLEKAKFEAGQPNIYQDPEAAFILVERAALALIKEGTPVARGTGGKAPAPAPAPIPPAPSSVRPPASVIISGGGGSPAPIRPTTSGSALKSTADVEAARTTSHSRGPQHAVPAFMQ